MASIDVIEIEVYLVGNNAYQALVEAHLFDDYKSAREYADEEHYDHVYWVAATIDPVSIAEVV